MKELISQNKLEIVFNEVLKITRDKDVNIYNDLYSIMSRYNNLSTELRIGIKSNKEISLEKNQINKALIEIIDVIYK